MTLFWDSKSPLLVDILPDKKTINGEYYANLLVQLRKTIKDKRWGKVSKGVLLLHNNAPPHKSKVAQAALRQCNFEELAHPPYSSDLAPSDFHVFRKLKLNLKGKRFLTKDEVITAVWEWLDSMHLSFWYEGITRCKQRWLTCHNRSGDYVEK